MKMNKNKKNDRNENKKNIEIIKSILDGISSKIKEKKEWVTYFWIIKKNYLYIPTTTAWSRSYGSSVTCSNGLTRSCCNFFTSWAKTASAGAVESIQLA